MEPDDHIEDQDRILRAMIDAIHAARINYPDAGDGTQHDRIWVAKEDAAFLAQAALGGLKAAGFRIVRAG
ncbi:MAG TPA: hypothetical protein VF552_11535 [Allosphingosinicella sp.]